MSHTHIIKKAIITENSLADASNGVFSFAVDKRATKHQIKQAVESFFDVDVVSVRTAKIPHSIYKTGKRRVIARTSVGKKARVVLKKGQTIDLFDIDNSKQE